MAKSVKRRTRRIRRIRRTRSMRKPVGKGIGFSRARKYSDSIFTEEDARRVNEDFKNGKFPKKYEIERRKRLAKEERERRRNTSVAQASTRPPSKSVSIIYSTTSENPSGVPNKYIDDFIDTYHPSLNEKKKNKLKKTLQDEILYDSNWFGEFSREILQDEEEQFIEKVQIWLKEGSNPGFINHTMSGEDLKPFTKLKHFRNTH